MLKLLPLEYRKPYNVIRCWKCWSNGTDRSQHPRAVRQETHDAVLKWKHFPRYWTFVRGIHRSPVDSPTEASDAELWFFYQRLYITVIWDAKKLERSVAVYVAIILSWLNDWGWAYRYYRHGRFIKERTLYQQGQLPLVHCKNIVPKSCWHSTPSESSMSAQFRHNALECSIVLYCIYIISTDHLFHDWERW